MKLLSRLLSPKRNAKAPQVFDAPLAPEEPIAVVGDIHGSDRLLQNLLDKLEGFPDHRIVFVGDYVDRGEDSAAVLTRLHARATAPGSRDVFLMGNHEEMMLRFIDAPDGRERRWLRFGGLQTLASYGIGQISQSAPAEHAVRARDELVEALGADLLAWLRALPRQFVSGNVAVVHAAADPALPIAAQSEAVLSWGLPDFTETIRSDGVWVVHGHTITATVAPRDGRIGVDTGAYANGRLTAGLIGTERFEVLTATY